MGILSLKDKKCQDSISVQSLGIALETVDAAAKAYFHAPNPHIKQEILSVIEAALPEGFTRYTTPNGLIVERVAGYITVRAEKTSESGLCPYCNGDLLKAEVVAQDKVSRWIETTVFCKCGCFVKVMERRVV